MRTAMHAAACSGLLLLGGALALDASTWASQPPQAADDESPAVSVFRQVRVALGDFLGQSKNKRNWGPEQVTGAPDTPEAGDQVTAWASQAQDDREEWLICHYQEPVRATAVRVYETYNPGALTKITILQENDDEVLAWEGVDPTPRDVPKGVSVIPIASDNPVVRIKLYLDSVAVSGWNEIDAVGLEDDQGNMHWAVKVTASSTYAQQEAPELVMASDGWAPEQVIGEPDTLEAGDAPSAWASATQDDQREWLICEYESAIVPASVVVHENTNPGAVYKITAFDADGREHLVWEGEDPTPRDAASGVSVFPLQIVFPTRRIKIHIDSPAVPGWNEIDAVGLRDQDDQTFWAVGAEASSTYAAAVSGLAISNRTIGVDLEEWRRLQEEIAKLREEVAELRQLRDELKELRKRLDKVANPAEDK